MRQGVGGSWLRRARSIWYELKPWLAGAWSAGYSLKTRLYSLIVFLGLLPVLGAALGLVAIEFSQRDGAALDQAAGGTVRLERVNSLVYAVFMDTRSIYASPDWNTAEPFAKDLTRQLGELQDVARAWKADAIASQQSNIEDLAERSINSCIYARSWCVSPRKKARQPRAPLATPTRAVRRRLCSS